MKPIKRAVIKTGEYQQNGQTKGKYLRVGTLFKRDDGSVTLALECVPVGVTGTAWINFYDIEQKQQTQSAPPPSAPPPDLDDEIPF